MSGPSDCHIDPVVFLDESSRLSANHSNEDDIELAALGRVDRNNLLFHILLNKLIHNSILLSIVRSYDIDILFLEAQLWDVLYLLMDLFAFLELAEAEVSQINYCLHLLKVDK